MKIESTFLRSRVARRIFFLFVFCALLPIGMLAVVIFYQVSNELKVSAQLELQSASKAKGMSLLERLENLDTELQAATEFHSKHADPASATLRAHFRGIESTGAKGSVSAWFGMPTAPPQLAADELYHLNSGKTLLLSAPCAGGEEMCLFLLRASEPGHAEAGLLIGGIESEYLWDRENLPTGLELSVFDAKQQPLYGSKASVPPEFDKSPQNLGRSFEWTLGRENYDASYWNLFLAQRFHTAPWTIVLSRQQEDAASILLRFRSTFPLVALLAFWVVALLSSIQIRRTLVPLEKLQEGTRLLGAQRFDTRVDVQSKDEFQDLATSFNAMAGQLGKQFEALKTINEIDQAILSSLHRDGIVDAVLDRLPSLLGCECCGVVLFNDSRFSSGSSLTTISIQAATRKQVESVQLSAGDMKLLHENPNSLRVGPDSDMPQLLKALRCRGGISLTIFPVFGEKQLTAAVTCVHSSAEPMAEVDRHHARQIADQLGIALANVQLMEAMDKLNWGTLTALARAIDAKSGWTGGHSERVTRLALRSGRAMRLNDRELQILHRGGLLHDIGKIGTPPGILDKPGTLDAAEMAVMREHVRTGLRILEPIPGLSEALPIVAQHHEWFDGSGYPQGLAGDQISLYARIFAVADCYDAVTSERPYRQGVSSAKALEMIQSGSGTQFDPVVVDAFSRIWKEQEESEPAVLPV